MAILFPQLFFDLGSTGFSLQVSIFDFVVLSDLEIDQLHPDCFFLRVSKVFMI
jgi:hypothetical protein